MQHILPQQIINRPKKGFNMPVAYWLTGDLRELTLDMLSQTRLTRQGLFNYTYVKHLLDEHMSLVFQLWYDRYLDT